MPRARMFREGNTVTMAELIEGIQAGEWFCINGKPTHPGWIASMQLRAVMTGVAMGRICRAIRNDPQAIPAPIDPAEIPY